jgi:hypothetical protein
MKNTLIFIWIVLAFASCRKADKTIPVISNVKINGVPSIDASITAGTIVTIQFDVSDNEELNQVKVNIHAADDGHVHPGMEPSDTIPNIGIWETTNVFDLVGTSDSRELGYFVPDTVSGSWHAEIQLIDMSGNQAEEVVVILEVE